MTIRLLTFDLDNTLWDIEPQVVKAEQCMYQWLAQAHPATASLYSLDDIRLYQQQLAQSIPDLAFRLTALRKETLRRVFMQGGATRTQAQQLAELAFAQYFRERNRVQLFAGVESLLSDLSQRYSLVALTNGNADLSMIGIERYFSGYFNAESVNAPKPDPIMFEAALQAANVLPRHALHIGDHPEHDVLGAKRVGMKAVWVNLTRQIWPEQVDVAPDAVIEDLAQLPSVIEALSLGR